MVDVASEHLPARSWSTFDVAVVEKDDGVTQETRPQKINEGRWHGSNSKMKRSRLITVDPRYYS